MKKTRSADAGVDAEKKSSDSSNGVGQSNGIGFASRRRETGVAGLGEECLP